jgi:hypothetical protein
MITPPPKPSNPEKNPAAKPINGNATQTIFSTLAYCPPKSILVKPAKLQNHPKAGQGLLAALLEDH